MSALPMPIIAEFYGGPMDGEQRVVVEDVYEFANLNGVTFRYARSVDDPRRYDYLGRSDDHAAS